GTSASARVTPRRSASSPSACARAARSPSSTRCGKADTASYPPEGQEPMRKKRTERYSAQDVEAMQSRTNWERVDGLSDEEIEAATAGDPDAEPLPADWLDTAELIVPGGEKERITIRIDRDVAEYFRRQGAGYQTRINAVLRAYVVS